MSASPDERLDIIAYNLDPWAAVAEDACCSARTEIVGAIRELAGQGHPKAWPVGFEISLQEKSFWGQPVSTGCPLLMRDFGIFYRPREFVRPIRDRPPSEVAAHYLFRECGDLSVAALCKANALLGGPGSIRTHEHRSSRYPSGHRSIYMPAERVPDETEYLVSQINGQFDLDPFRFAATAMLHCLTIHPFSDANGRLSFLLFQYCLFRAGVINYPIVPVGPFLEKHRPEYLHALISCSIRETVIPFHDLLGRALVATAQAAEEALFEEI